MLGLERGVVRKSTRCWHKLAYHSVSRRFPFFLATAFQVDGSVMNANNPQALGAELGLESLRFGSSATVRRVEDRALLLGEGQFTDDLQRNDLAHLVFLRSPYGHAEILGIDSDLARAMPGVLAIYTGAELVAAGVKALPAPPPSFLRPDGSPAASAPRRGLAHERVRFAGEAVAAVVATTRQLAIDAAEAIDVRYEVLPAVTDAHAAMQPGAPVLCAQAPDNVVAHARSGDPAATDAAFVSAAHVVELQIRNQRLAPASIEPRVVMAETESATGRLVMTLSSQMPTAVRDSLANALPGLTKDQVRVRVHDVGGGFGMKTGIYPEDLVVGFAARELKQPVRWQAQRLEEFMTAVHGRGFDTLAALALDQEGRILGLRCRTLANAGAYATPTACVIPLVLVPFVSTSVYDIPVMDLHNLSVMTNTSPLGAYRGAGRPEAIYVVERLMDAAALQLGMDPVALRRRNLIAPQQMPYRTPAGQVYDSGEFEKMLDQALQLSQWDDYAARDAATRASGRLRGRSVATFLEWTGGGALTEMVKVEVRADHVIELTSATLSMGQGIVTSYVQLAAEVFGVPVESIRIIQGDTDRANGFGSAGSRSLFTGGGAVHVASERTVEHAKSLAAEALEVAEGDLEYHGGQFTVVGTDLKIGLFELAARQPEARIQAAGETTAGGPSWPNACHICEVEIDPETGAVAVVAYSSVNDIGRVISPQIVEGQIDGGVVQGIGQALCEQVVYDETGQLLTASFMDYAMPRADIQTQPLTAFDPSVPCKTNVLGAKGVGELGTIGATPAVVNAVLNALVTAGVPHSVAFSLQMPLTSERVWQALQTA
jgi:carbon-monoxide dehydrogenase large subunit